MSAKSKKKRKPFKRFLFSSRLSCQIVIDQQTPDGIVFSIPSKSLIESMDSWCKN